MKPTIFITAPRLSASGVRLLEQSGARLIYLPEASGIDVENILAREPVDAIISRTVELSARAINSCSTLKVISKHGVGVSNIAVEAATARGIPVYVTPAANAQSVTELALGLMLAASRRIAWMDSELRAGRWSRNQDGLELNGRTLGLVGLGQIGQRLGIACLSLGMRVLAFDPALEGKPTPIAGIELCRSLDDMLPNSDVLSLHVPLNSHTRHLIDARRLALLPDNAIVINTARGEVIQQDDLINALRSGRLYAAGLDTMREEPLPENSPLLQLSNVVLTPHVGGSTPAALDRMAQLAAKNVLGYLGGSPPAPGWCINPDVLKI